MKQGYCKRLVLYSINCCIECYIQVLYNTSVCYIALNIACVIYYGMYDAI